MRDDEQRLGLELGSDRLLNARVRRKVDGSSRFIEDNDLAVFDQCTGKRDEGALADGAVEWRVVS